MLSVTEKEWLGKLQKAEGIASGVYDEMEAKDYDLDVREQVLFGLCKLQRAIVKIVMNYDVGEEM